MKHIAFVIGCLLLLGCAHKGNVVASSPKSADENSLEYWTPDTVFNTNPRLVRLMDSLYRYTMTRYPSENTDADIRWMDGFRKRVCEYYKSAHHNDTISEFAMAASVMREDRELWALDTEYSTVAMTMRNNMEYSRLIFEQFCEYSGLLKACDKESRREALRNELMAWIRLEQEFSKFYSDCVTLAYCGGTMADPKSSGEASAVSQSHKELYANESKLMSCSPEWEPSGGTFITPARTLLMECCREALRRNYCKNCSEHDPNYEKTMERAKKSLAQLSEYLDSWIETRKVWQEEACTDGTRMDFELDTSGVPIRLAGIISSI